MSKSCDFCKIPGKELEMIRIINLCWDLCQECQDKVYDVTYQLRIEKERILENE